jgi:hypothetical protein
MHKVRDALVDVLMSNTQDRLAWDPASRRRHNISA